MESHFRVETRDEGRAALVVVAGELDLASSPALEDEFERIATSPPELVIVDLRQLEFMDSTGLSVLVKANQRAGEDGRRFALAGGPPQVQRLLHMTGVGKRLTVVETPEELLD
jgi:anti-sigma B factor antagonist